MSASPKVSIVIPTYNREKLLPISVDSVRNQTVTDWELLLVDDHSQDASKCLIEKWAADDCRIKYFPNERTKGPAGARNTGLTHASGEYVAFLDSDDEWVPSHLENCLRHLQDLTLELDVVGADAVRRHRGTGEKYSEDRLCSDRFSGSFCNGIFIFDAADQFEASLRTTLLTTQTIVLCKRVVEKIRFAEDLPPGPEDVFFQQQIAYEGFRIGRIPETHLTYWAHGDNLTVAGGQNNPAKIVSLTEAFLAADRMKLSTFDLTNVQRRWLRQRMAEGYVWHLGASEKELGNTSRARNCIVEGIRLDPFRFQYWKALMGILLTRKTSDCQVKTNG